MFIVQYALDFTWFTWCDSSKLTCPISNYLAEICKGHNSVVKATATKQITIYTYKHVIHLKLAGVVYPSINPTAFLVYAGLPTYYVMVTVVNVT